ncbi:DUF397 domain-containing protein [Streptomyces sp. NPDC058470]|uniref:DUF397 domain-containing protein n=1 Tax=Streptomyces sp. NPDC058470 TaxID=3346515 RepID=UPI003664A544
MRNSQDLTGARWRKSTYSGGTRGECVEVAHLTPHIAVRDPKNPGRGALTVTPQAFAAFVAAAATGVLDQGRCGWGGPVTRRGRPGRPARPAPARRPPPSA